MTQNKTENHDEIIFSLIFKPLIREIPISGDFPLIEPPPIEGKAYWAVAGLPDFGLPSESISAKTAFPRA